MGMKKGPKQYGKGYTEAIFKLHYIEGKNIRQTAEILGTNPKSVVNAITREHASQRKIETGELQALRRGRPRTKPLTTLEQLQMRNKELEMENELLKKCRKKLMRR